MTVESFRAFVIDIRQPKPYCPVVTEVKGVLNIMLGFGELLSGYGMKYSSNHNVRDVHGPRHITMGTNTLVLGLKQFVPGAVVVVAAGMLLARKWSHES